MSHYGSDNNQGYPDKVRQLYVFLLSNLVDTQEILRRFNEAQVIDKQLTLDEFNEMARRINSELAINKMN